MELSQCSALIIPGGESTTIALIAERTGLLEPLRAFVKVQRRPTWGTCAGMILLAERANRTKAGGQQLLGGLDVKVNRNHFGRQVESFQAQLDLSACFAKAGEEKEEEKRPFPGVFIRAPIVEAVLDADADDDDETTTTGKTAAGAGKTETRTGEARRSSIAAPSLTPVDPLARSVISDRVQVLARLHRGLLPTEGLSRSDRRLSETNSRGQVASDAGETDTPRERERASYAASSIVAVRQGNVVGTSFHPELTADTRLHAWWLRIVLEDVNRRRAGGGT